MIESVPLGQSGFRFTFGDIVLYIDPYLSDSVARIEGSHLKRLVPVKIRPEDITDADWVLITHIHLDHCDLDTLLPLYRSSTQCIFVGTHEVVTYLEENGFDKSRLITAPKNWISLGSDLKIIATPAAHPSIETDKEGNWQCAGYLLEYQGRKIYHAGDTFVVKPLIEYLQKYIPIHTALLPVNEHNYFRENQGIIGNMGIRDAFGLATELGVKKLVPMHWDMFEPNTVFTEEIDLLYRLLKPPFEIVLHPTEL